MNKKLNLELAKEYFKLASISSLAIYALLAVALYFYWGKIPTPILLTWFGVNFLSATLLLVFARLFKRHSTEESAQDWLKIYAYLVLLLDVPWGLFGPLSFTIESDAYRMLALFMLAGMSAGAIVTRALVFRTYVISLSALLVPITITLALERTAVGNAMLALVLIYVIFMLAVAKNYSATIRRNILLWLENEKLVAQLRSSNAEVEETNQVLTQEIEHRKQIESELVEAKEKSERASEAKNQFLATVSHELRTPLNGIMGFADLLRDENLEKQHQDYVGQISKAGRTLLHIVNDILDITAIEAGHISFYEEPFSLRDELQEVKNILRPLAERKKLTLQLRVGEDVEDGLHGDINRLRQIVSNLLSNALKYTDAGQIGLTVSQVEERDDKVVLRFEVEDTGIGIAAKEMSTIFDNFTRLENFETRRGEGTGLGLAIVKNLVQKMEGRLAVRSTPGIGSCFSFDLPLRLSTDRKQKMRRMVTPGLTPAQWRNLHVLVVDDNEINRMVLTTFLGKTGIPFLEAANGGEALKHIRSNRFDVVLLDIQMPDISGIDVAKKVQEELVTPPALIAVTAHAFPEQRQAILNAGFSDFLVKPIEVADLRESLSRAYRERYDDYEVSEKQQLM